MILPDVKDWNEIFEKWDFDFDSNKRHGVRKDQEIRGMELVYGSFQEGMGTEFKEHISMTLYPTTKVGKAGTDWFVVSDNGGLYWKLVVFEGYVDVYIRFQCLCAGSMVCSLTENIPQEIFDNCEFGVVN
jgi:hypothetical protein